LLIALLSTRHDLAGLRLPTDAGRLHGGGARAGLLHGADIHGAQASHAGFGVPGGCA
jgi:hypothetical protein